MNLIGIAGNATCGKDTLCRLLINLISESGPVYRIAFADCLKDELDKFLIETTGISAWTTDPEEKKIIRPMLVFWGTEFRRQHDENHWVKAAQTKMTNPDATYIVTDLRFQNEYNWIKSLGGKTIFLDRIKEDGSFVAPANNYEAENNLFLKMNADVAVAWNTWTNDDDQPRIDFIKENILTKLHNEEPTKPLLY